MSEGVQFTILPLQWEPPPPVALVMNPEAPADYTYGVSVRGILANLLFLCLQIGYRNAISSHKFRGRGRVSSPPLQPTIRRQHEP